MNNPEGMDEGNGLDHLARVAGHRPREFGFLVRLRLRPLLHVAQVPVEVQDPAHRRVEEGEPQGDDHGILQLPVKNDLSQEPGDAGLDAQVEYFQDALLTLVCCRSDQMACPTSRELLHVLQILVVMLQLPVHCEDLQHPRLVEALQFVQLVFHLLVRQGQDLGQQLRQVVARKHGRRRDAFLKLTVGLSRKIPLLVQSTSELCQLGFGLFVVLCILQISLDVPSIDASVTSFVLEFLQGLQLNSCLDLGSSLQVVCSLAKLLDLVLTVTSRNPSLSSKVALVCTLHVRAQIL
mmetsp:Transcript_100979/g.324200  ORF Transcript_100979/g.324200 Transcript_100979/m.324200 type:complete len:293 (+) Transcript_100979:2231-3109(+)